MDDIHPEWEYEEAKSSLRRSSRKSRRSSIPAASVFCSTPSSKKSRNQAHKDPSSVQVASLTTLPFVVTRELLKYLDVETLECLSKTCFYFDQLIAGQFLLSIDFPFPADLSADVAHSNKLEKKPLLRMRCKKTKGIMNSSSNLLPHQIDPISMHSIITKNCPNLTDYVVHCQLSLLSLDKLRELDLVPEGISRREGGSRMLDVKTMQAYEMFDLRLLRQINRMGSLEYVTRLDVLVDHNFYRLPLSFPFLFPSLIQLGLNIIERPGMSTDIYINKHLRRLKQIVAACTAPVLKLTIVRETRRKINKVLRNSYVEKLIVEGPCTMNLVLKMEKLKEVLVKLDDSSQHDNCTFWKSKQGDRDQHRVGLCCVNIGKLYETCPKLEKFMGVEVGSVTKESFGKWNSKIKKKFYQQYLGQGGTLEFKRWAKSRWFSKMPDSKEPVEHPLWNLLLAPL